MYANAAIAILSLCIGFAGAWRIQDARQHTKELENDQIRAAEGFAASNAATTQAITVVQAQNEGKRRSMVLRSSAGDSADQLRVLNAANASALQAASVSLDACVERAATAGRLLDSCGAAYQELGERADRHVNDIKTLIEAWPTSAPSSDTSR